MTSDRSEGRIVHLFQGETLHGGLQLIDGITNSNFYDMVEIICLINAPYHLQHQGEAILEEQRGNASVEQRETILQIRKVERDDAQMLSGKYSIIAEDPSMYSMISVPN